jgi:hypothetical protein
MRHFILCLFTLINISAFSQINSDSISGQWTNLQEEAQVWDFKINGRFELIVNCGGLCEGSDTTFYVDEAGSWEIKDNQVVVTLNENNGKPFTPEQKLILTEIKLENKSFTFVILDRKKKINMELKR